MLAIFATARAFLGKIPSWAWIALAALALLWLIDHNAYNRGRDRMREKVTEAQAATDAAERRHAVTRASVGTLQAEVGKCMADARERDEAYQAVQDRAAQANAANDRLARNSQATIARLRELAEAPGECAVDPAIRELAEGL